MENKKLSALTNQNASIRKTKTTTSKDRKLNSQISKIHNFKTLRVSGSTKKDVDDLLKKINESDDCGKVTVDTLIKYLAKNTTSQDIENLQLSSTTWVHEEKRLRKLYEKKNGKIPESKWKQMLCLGELREFFHEHSRLSIG